MILDVKQLNETIKLYYFYALIALWDGQAKIKMYCRISRVKKQLSGKRSIKRFNVRERVEAVEWIKKKMVLHPPLLFCKSSVSVKENPDKKTRTRDLLLILVVLKIFRYLCYDMPAQLQQILQHIYCKSLVKALLYTK